MRTLFLFQIFEEGSPSERTDFKGPPSTLCFHILFEKNILRN